MVVNNKIKGIYDYRREKRKSEKTEISYIVWITKTFYSHLWKFNIHNVRKSSDAAICVYIQDFIFEGGVSGFNSNLKHQGWCRN